MKQLKKTSLKFGQFFKTLSMFIVLISVTFSWMTFAKEASVNPLETHVIDAVDIAISDLTGEYWGSSLEVVSKKTYGSITEFSGNGDKLYIPTVSGKTITGYYLPDYSEREKNFVEIDVKVRSATGMRLFVSPESFVSPLNDKFNKDSIVGAVRVAFLIENFKPYIWAPNSTYEFKNGRVNKNGTPESSYSFVYSDSKDTFIGTDNVVTIDNSQQHESGFNTEHNFLWGNPDKIENYPYSVGPIFTVNEPDGEEVVVEMKIRIWIEGTDREAVADLVGGRITSNIKFFATGNGSGGAA